MQSPEEIAQKLVDSFGHYFAPDALVSAIAAALTAYGDACAARERERCARIAERYITGIDMGAYAPENIAATIRALS